MATGFVDRQKGKVAAAVGTFFVGGVQVNASGADQNTSVGWGTVNAVGPTGSTIPSGGVTQVTSTAIAVYNLANPSPGRVTLISITTSSTAVMVKTAAGVTIAGAIATLGGSSLSNTIKSTSTLVATEIELVGLSTVAYLFNGVSPSTTSHLLFSTTT